MHSLPQIKTSCRWAVSLCVVLTAFTLHAKAAEKGKALFTLYYVTEVKPVAKGGRTGKYKTTAGKWLKYRVSRSDDRRGHMEGTVVSAAPDGTRITTTIIRVGVWEDLPAGWHGKGNRGNPLLPYRTVAADQRRYPYGSRIFIQEVAGYKTPDGKVLDGYFWVADVGSRIKGRMRFDIFVGGEPNYRMLKKLDSTKWRGSVAIERIPKLPKAWDPRTVRGLVRILHRSGCDPTNGSATPIKNDRSVRRLEPAEKSCLVHFQKSHKAIPPVEYGMAMGAITLWHLAQAARKAIAEKRRQRKQTSK